ncbi:MAG: amino acid--tRNA ligase-related protein, partial [Verrucomicrobiota bacterium]
MDQDVTLQGWVQGIRSGGKVVFVQFRDGTGLCQAVIEAAHEEAFQTVKDLSQETSLEITGKVLADERAPGGFEISVTAARVIHGSEDYPITRKAHGTDFLMNHRHLWLRSPRQAAILRIRHTLIRETRNFFDQNGFTLIDTPIFSPGAGEGASTLFSVPYLDEQDVYLAQTGQLYLESAIFSLRRVYCFGPTFRAEKSKTRRHLTEFWMVEPEVAFADLDDIMELSENFIAHLVQSVLKQNLADLETLERDIEPLKKVTAPFPRITYSEAVDMLKSDEVRDDLTREMDEDQDRLKVWNKELDDLEKQKANVQKAWKQEKLAQEIQAKREAIKELEIDLKNRPDHIQQVRDFEWGKDLGGNDETVLSRRFDKPVIVSEYPREVKAFYMKQSPDDPRVVPLARGLSLERGGGLRNTQERAYGLLALAEYAEHYEPDDPSFLAHVWAGSTPQPGVRFDTLDAPALRVDSTLGELGGVAQKRRVTLRRQGRGRAYYRVGMRWSPAEPPRTPVAAGIAVEATLRSAKGVLDEGDVIAPGTPLALDLTLSADAPLDYVVLEVPLPA